MFRAFRIIILLFILFLVAASTWLTQWRTASWDETQWVAIYPINPEDNARVQEYIERLDNEHFTPVEQFFNSEAEHYGLSLAQPVEVVLAHQVERIPPAPPADQSILKVMLWSLQLRYWAWQVDEHAPTPHIRMFVQYFDSKQHKSLRHSLGLDKGMLGVVNAFATRLQTSRNQVVIAHEIMHTLGATDKYDLDSGLPNFPEGYANPEQTPLYPQRNAEIMGARIALAQDKAEIPPSLEYAVIGASSAREINWMD